MSAGGVLLVGGGNMGGALARGWKERERLFLYDPNVAAMPGATKLDRLEPQGLPAPLTVVVAVKPQILPRVLPSLRPFADADALIVSIAAGVSLATLGRSLGRDTRVVRAMPNVASAVLRGVTAAVPSPSVGDADRARVDELLGAVGDLVWLDDERLIDAVTALSGSGPAYFFRVTEALARAGVAAGIEPDAAMRFARATFTGAAALADVRPDDGLAQLRIEVTSPHGVTAEALAVLDRDDALDRLMADAMMAGAARSAELGE